MKLYHFVSEKYGLQAIKNQRIKVSHLDDLNDPFELYATRLTDHKSRNEVDLLGQHIIDTFGILCLSRQWRSPLLWSHYANRHKGVALELEVTEKRVKKIKYQQKRIEIDSSQVLTWLMNVEKLQDQLLTTKYSQWRYEDEARVFLTKEEIYKESDLSFFDFNEDCKLIGVISGPLCELSETKIKRVLPSGKSVKFTKSRLAFRSYDVVRHNIYKPRVVK